MKKLLILCLLISASAIYSNQKYFIYFKDKGPAASLRKDSPCYQEALHLLSSRAIERREKAMSPDSIITFEDLPLYSDYIERLIILGIKVENKLKWFNAITAWLNEDQKQAVLSLPFVRSVIPVKILSFNDKFREGNLFKTVTPDNLIYGNSYDQLALSDIPAVHSKGITGSGIIVGLLDSGFRTSHSGLTGINVIADSDFVFHDGIVSNEPEDDPEQDSHGTYVLSVIGGFKDSTIIGASYGSSFILSKTEDIRSETHVEEDNYAAALEWMEGLGVDVTSSSLGYNEFDPPDTSYTYEDMNGNTAIVTKAANLAFQRGVVVITAAGNEGNTKWHYIIAPSDGFNVIAVGAVYQDGLLASFSSRGPTYDGRIKPDVVAMGVDVYGASTSGTDNFTYASGTSASTPIAGGVAALLLSVYPHLNNDQVKNIFLETSDRSSEPNNEYGYGLVSAGRAISYPNLKFNNGVYTLYKSYIDSITVSDVRLHYSLNGMPFDSLNMNAEISYKFSCTLAGLSSNQVVYFYFTYNDESGKVHRDPQSGNYKFKPGSLTISYSPGRAVNYILSNNYPNPFNSSTKINYYAGGNLPAEVIIYDALGRKVRTIFKGNSNPGINIVEWDGKTDAGIYAASGIYICFLKLEGNIYTHKMVCLR